jgi:hypothetical protein
MVLDVLVHELGNDLMLQNARHMFTESGKIDVFLHQEYKKSSIEDEEFVKLLRW